MDSLFKAFWKQTGKREEDRVARHLLLIGMLNFFFLRIPSRTAF